MINEILLTIMVFVVCLAITNAITNLVFGREGRVKAIPVPPQTENKPMFTTDLIVNENTKWFTEQEFFGKGLNPSQTK
jgi:hypothetical protein